MNARFTYSSGVSNVNKFGETFNGLLSRTTLRQQIDTGGLDSSGRLADEAARGALRQILQALARLMRSRA